jgi:hypothetical protein
MKRRTDTLSRRELGAALAFATPALAQQPATPAEDVDTAARQRLQRSRDQLRKIKVPMSTEPSFVFRP